LNCFPCGCFPWHAHTVGTESGIPRGLENGASIADLLGFELPLKVNMQNLVRYHSACLGFTGSGRSNFTPHLIREAMKAHPDLRVVIFDIAGEYFASASCDLLDKTLDLETGQRLFVSYEATKRKNVPVFIQASDNEAILAKALVE
jgi:DNA helicase HerA-like ATPase